MASCHGPESSSLLPHLSILPTFSNLFLCSPSILYVPYTFHAYSAVSSSKILTLYFIRSRDLRTRCTPNVHMLRDPSHPYGKQCRSCAPPRPLFCNNCMNVFCSSRLILGYSPFKVGGHLRCASARLIFIAAPLLFWYILYVWRLI